MAFQETMPAPPFPSCHQQSARIKCGYLLPSHARSPGSQYQHLVSEAAGWALFCVGKDGHNSVPQVLTPASMLTPHAGSCRCEHSLIVTWPRHLTAEPEVQSPLFVSVPVYSLAER